MPNSNLTMIHAGLRPSPSESVSQRAAGKQLSGLERLPRELTQDIIVPLLRSFGDKSITAFGGVSRRTHEDMLGGVARPLLARLQTAELYGVFGLPSDRSPPPFGQCHPAAEAYAALDGLRRLMHVRGVSIDNAGAILPSAHRSPRDHLHCIKEAVDLVLTAKINERPRLSFALVSAVERLEMLMLRPLQAWLENEKNVLSMADPSDAVLTARSQLDAFYARVASLAGTKATETEMQAYPPCRIYPPLWLYFMHHQEADFDGAHQVAIPEGLGYQTALQTIRIQSDTSTLPASLARLPCLTYIHYHNDIQLMPTLLPQLTGLETLILAHAPKDPAAAVLNFSGFSNLVRLRELAIAHHEIPDEIFACTQLEHLSVFGVATISPKIDTLQKLITVNFDYNDLICLPRQFLNLPNLQSIEAQEGTTDDFLFAVRFMPSLRKLNLFSLYNLEDFEKLPATIGHLEEIAEGIYVDPSRPLNFDE